jgi:hypothetical protein
LTLPLIPPGPRARRQSPVLHHRSPVPGSPVRFKDVSLTPWLQVSRSNLRNRIVSGERCRPLAWSKARPCPICSGTPAQFVRAPGRGGDEQRADHLV